MATSSDWKKKRFEDTLSEMNSKYGSKKEEPKSTKPSSSAGNTGSTGTKITNNSTKSTANAKKVQRFEETYKEMESRYNKGASVDGTYINTFLKDAQSFLNRSASKVNGLNWSSATSGSGYDSWEKEYASMKEKEENIRSYLRQNKSKMDSSTYKELSSLLDTFHWNSVDTKVAFNNAKKHYSQWKTEDEYNKWKKDTEEYEALKNFDIKKGEAEIEHLNKILDEYKFHTRWMTDENGEARAEYIRQNYGDEQGIKALIAEKKATMNRAKHIQEGITLAGVIENDDFKENSGYVSTKADGGWKKLTSDFGMGYDDLTYEYINGEESGMRQEIINKAVAYDADTEKFFVYDHMTEDQISTYNYYYAKDGKEAAEKYLNSIQETLNYQAATQRYEKMEGKTALEMLFGIEAGVDQFQSGIKNLFNNEDDYIAQSSTQMMSGMVREDLADNGFKLPDWLGGASIAQAGYDAITTTANMVPSIMTSTVMNFVAPGSGAVVGTTMMGASAAGNAYQEMLNLGYDKSQARAYSTLVGASEAGLQYLLGGIGSLGGKLSGNALTKMLNGIDNAFLRTALKLGGNMLSEGLEEGLQEVLTPWFQNLIMNTDENINWSEVAYSTLLGALTAGFMEGPTTIGDAVSIRNTGKQLQAADISAARLAEVGKTFSADTVAYQLAGRVNENTGAYTMGRLFNEIGATLSEQNVAEITNALVAKGMDQTTAKKNAEALAYVVEGGQLTDTQIAVIEGNEVLAEVARTTLIDANTTWNQRTNALKALADEMTSPKASRMNPAKQSQDKAPAADTVDAQNNEAVQSLSEAETVDTSPAKVQTISSIENGQVTVKLEDGTEINVKEADLSVDDGVRIETIAKLEGISAADANFILNTLRTNTSTSAQMDSLGAREAYKYGFYGFSQDHMTTHGVFANSLTETQRKAIYETGRAARQRQVEAKQAVAKNATTTNKDSNKISGKVHFEGDRSTLTERQSASLTAMERVAEALGVQIYVFESKLNARGKRVGENGWYDPKDSSIHIDLHAGANGEGTMLFTLAHELTHHIRKWSPAKFKVLADFLMQEYGKKGVNVDALVREQMAKAKRNGRTISYDTAYEEVVADSMEMMLADGKVMEKLAKLKAQDKDLWQKIKDFISELAVKIRAVYKGMSPDSVEGRHVAEMVDAIDRLQDLFTEALVEASNNFQSAMETVVEADAETVSENEIITDGAVVTDGDGKKYSIRSMKQDIAEGQMFEDLKTYCGWTQKQVNELRNNLADLVEYMTPYRNILDMNETYGREGRRFSPYKPNSDPLYKISMDFSTLCSKRLLTQYVIENLQLRENRPMSAEEQMAIRDMLNEYRKVEKGLQVACAMCYVEAARLKSPKQITKWMEDPGTQMKNYFADKNPEFANFIKEKQADFKESRGYDRNATKKDMSPKDVRELNKIRPRLRSQYQLSAEEAKIIKRAKSLPGSTYLTAGNLASLSETDPTIYAAYTAFVRTATRSKSLETDEPYYYGDSRRDNGNGIIVSDSFIEAVNRENGMRFSSWSDWRIQHLLDYIAAVIDNSVRGAAMHGYTKFGEEVRVLGKTGMMFNMSGVAGTQTGLNEDGSLSFSPTESIDVNEAIQLREEFPDTAGLQCIGVGDDHIIALLRSDIIDYVIPYHVSGLNAGLRAMANIHGWKDYTSTQHAAIDKSIKFENAVDQEHWHEEPVYSEFFVGYDTGMTGIEAMRASADRYVQMCKDRGLKPKFEQFVNEDNYWKLLIDRKMVNQKTGKLIQQKAVTPTFDFDTVKSVVDQFVQNYDSGLEARALNHIIENWDSIPKRIKDLKKQGSTKAKKAYKAVDTLANQTLAAQPTEIKRSDRDSDGNSLTEEQSAFFAHSKVRDADGNLMVMYHGTANGGAFTVFDGDKLGNDTRTTQVGQGFYFTNMKAEAEAYTKNVDIYGRTSGGKNPHLHQVYLNITKPFNIDSDTLDIDKVKSVYMDGTNDWFFSNWIPFYMKNKTLDGRTFAKAEVEAMSKADKVSVYVDYLAQLGTKEVLSNMVRAFPNGKQSELLTAMKNNLGYDGIVEEFKPGQYQYVAFSAEQIKATGNQNPTSDPDIRYSDRDNAPTFYSQMAKVVDGVKQEKLGAASVVSMLRGKGVKAEEIKWSGIETWLEGKKSVTKAELQEFIAGSMLQIEEETLDYTERPYTEDQKKRLTEYEAKRDDVVKRLVNEWKRVTGEEFPIQNPGYDLESTVSRKIIEANLEYKKASFEGRLLEKIRKDFQKVSEDNDDFGFDNWRDALRSLHRHRKDFINHYELSTNEKAVIVKYCNALNAYNEIQNRISEEDSDRLRDIAREAAPWNRKIMEVKHEYNEEAAKHMPKWDGRRYNLEGGKNYREVLFRIPDSTYTNDAMYTHWENRSGILAHARIQDFNTFIGKMLFIEELQSDWHNEGHKTGYKDVPDAPFRDNYHEFVLKRLIRMAAEQDYDSIGWTPAQIQVKRWSEKFAEGYRIEYDQDMPKFLNKYGKKWGTRVGKTVLDSGTEVWSMAITDSMKESVLTEGQPLYSDRDYQNVVSKAVETFGTTTDFAEAGFILPNGKMLKFTDDNHSGERQYDHRAIGIAYGVDVDLSVNHGFNYESNNHLNDFVENGGIRFDPGSMEFGMDAGMQLSKSIPITKEQEMAIRDFVEWKKQREEMYNSDDDPLSLYDGPLTLHIDFGGGAGFAISSSAKDLDAWGVKHLTYEGGQINASRIIADIRHYYRTGETRQQSSVAQFRYSDRDSESVSNRSLLANAFEGVAQNEMEKQKIQEYKGKISLIESEERKLSDLNQKIKDLSFAKGPKDTKAIRDLQFQAKQTANRISTYDKQLLALEASKPLQNVLTREKKMAYQRAEKKGKEALEAYREKTMKTQRELIDKWQESRKKGIESRQRTAMRHKIKDVVNELNQYLLRGTKDRHVPIELQKAVAEALDAVNMDTVGADERIAKLEAELMKAKTPEQIQEISRKIDHVREMGDRMNGRLKKLKDAYDQFVNSDDPMVADSHDEVISNKLQSVIESVGDTPLRDMTVTQLEDVYDMYRMVLTTIRNTNKAFKAKKSESISVIAGQVMMEVEKVGGKKKLSLKGTEGIKGFFWNNLKPVYAFEHIGSDHFTEVFNNVRAGEDVWALDVTEAREFYLDKSKKHGYDSWDFKKRYKFTSTSGMDFELDLEQIMSLYAYSKREQAADHLKRGGIVIDETTEITVKNKLGIPVKFNPTEATAYNISDATLAEIISKLTADQKDFVDVMQDYLSTVMGAKGNEVSLEMYGVKLFKEKFYFPLKSAQQFMAKAKEQQKGEVKIKNSGFSKETVQKASNPIVLTPFMNVWADHVNEMSMYHAFVLPMEDFYRVYNYKTPTSDTMATESVEMFIQNAYGKGATKYIDQLLKDLNGGARTDHTTGIINKMMGLFKKGAVFASLSVVVQQPSAIARAAALVDTKYFIGPKVDHKKHKVLWDEVKQYAPVAVIKEMGYFDTNMGKSTQDFILGKEYSGFKEKMNALFTDSGYRDEALSKAPALADEIAWCGIWEAVKRETKAKYPGLDTKAEPFLKLCGSRFTEVIVKTQVYDSVLSRSGLMRSKDTGMKMATAFMAEPTTSINMISDALLKGKRGNRKYARGAIGAVIASQILNSILVSFVYAGRDDDEDETYWEKYIGTLTGQTLDSLNPAGYIPFIKDIMSIVQGYDVERSDMAVISDLWKAWENLKKDTVSPYRKVEGFAGSIGQIFGLPVKNIMRDARGIYQTIDSFVNGQQTTKAGIGYAVKSALPAWAGGGDVSKDEQLYEAILSGDQAQIDRVKGRYTDEKAVKTAMRSAVKDHFLAGDIDSETALQYLVSYCGDDEDEAFWKVEEWTYNQKTEDAFSKYNEFYGAVRTGKDLKAIIKKYTDNGVTESTLKSQISDHFKKEYIEMSTSERASIKGYLLNAMTLLGDDREDAEKKISAWEFEAANGFNYENRRELYLKGEITGDQVRDAVMTFGGKTAEEADEYVESLLFEAEYGFAYSERADAYKSGEISAEELKHILMTAGGKTEEEADLQVQAYDWEAEGYEDVTSAAVREYAEHCASANVPKDVYLHIRSFSNNTSNDVDANGKTIYYSAMKKIMAEINAQYGLTNAQKDALARSMGWAEKNIQKYKLW